MRLHTAVLSAGLLLSGAQAAPAPAQADLWSRWVAQNFTDSPSVVQTEKYGTYVGLHLKDVKQDQVCGKANLALRRRWQAAGFPFAPALTFFATIFR